MNNNDESYKVAFRMAHSIMRLINEIRTSATSEAEAQDIDALVCSALAMVCGAALSATCLKSGAGRKDTFNLFDKLYRDYAKQHVEAEKIKSH